MENEHYKVTREQSIQSVMKQIKRASERGYTRTVFNPNVEVYDEIKEEFRKKGYEFAPTGYCGGVWQDSEDICW